MGNALKVLTGRWKASVHNVQTSTKTESAYHSLDPFWNSERELLIKLAVLRILWFFQSELYRWHSLFSCQNSLYENNHHFSFYYSFWGTIEDIRAARTSRVWVLERAVTIQREPWLQPKRIWGWWHWIKFCLFLL